MGMSEEVVEETVATETAEKGGLATVGVPGAVCAGSGLGGGTFVHDPVCVPCAAGVYLPGYGGCYPPLVFTAEGWLGGLAAAPHCAAGYSGTPAGAGCADAAAE